MTCIIYNDKSYSYDEFADLLLNGELENLAREKKVSNKITSIAKAISSELDSINKKFERKLAIEKAKYVAALNSSDDLIKLRDFLKKDPLKNTQLSDAEVEKQAKLSKGASANELKGRLATINKAWVETKKSLDKAKQLELDIAQQKPIVAKNKLELKTILRNLFNLKKVFKTTSGKSISQDEAAATLMDKIIETIAKRRSTEEGQTITAKDIYASTFYKRSTMEEINNSLETLKQLISADRAVTLPSYEESDIIIDFAGNKRYEISDSNSTFVDDISSPERVKELVKKLEKGTTLDKVLFHEELFRAYPELMKLPIGMKSFKDNRNRGFYNAKSFVFDRTSYIILNNKTASGEPITNISDTFVTLIHEIQHAIQHIESFNMGTTEDTFIQYVKDDKVATKLLLDIAEKSNSTNTPLKDFITPEDQLILDGSMMVITDTDAVVDKDVIKGLKEHLAKLDELTKGDIKTMYLNSIGEIEARVTEARAHFEEEDLKLFKYKDMMQTQANERNAPIFKDDMDAYFTVISNKTLKQPVLFQESEEDFIKRKAINNGNFLKAPNGKDSNLNSKQWIQVRTKAFKNWFGDWENDPINASKVVDENGEPLIMYHVSKSKEDFDFFDKNKTRAWGFYFMASKELRDEYKKGWDSEIVKEVFLSLKKPKYNVTTQPEFFKTRPQPNFYKNEESFTRATALWQEKNTENLRNFMVSQQEVLNKSGGIIQKFNNEQDNIIVIIPSNNASDIKSANSNLGTFDSKNVNINFQEAQAAYQYAGAYSTGNAKFDILKEGEDIIHSITNPNVSSPLHEMAHKFEKYLTQEERATVLAFAKTAEWTTETSETFARGFEKYLSEGKAPTSALQDIFDAFAKWLFAIYDGIINSDIDIELNDEMRAIYNAMLGSPTILKAAEIEMTAPEVQVETPTQPLSTVEEIKTELTKSLPQEVVDVVTIVSEAPANLTRNVEGLYLSLKNYFKKLGVIINSANLMGWLGKNSKEVDFNKVKNDEQLTEHITKSYSNLIKTIEKLKVDDIVRTRFNDWIDLLNNQPIEIRHSFLNSVYKEYQKNKSRRTLVMSPINKAAFSLTTEHLFSNPSHLSGAFNFYKGEIIKENALSLGLEPSKSGKGSWIHIPRTQENEKDYKINYKRLQQLSPKSWCTSSSHTATYLQKYDNYLLIVDGKVVVGIEVMPDVRDGKREVKDVTNIANSGVASIIHIDDTIAFLDEKGFHNRDRRGSIEKALNYSKANLTEEQLHDLEYSDEEENNEAARAAAVQTEDEAFLILEEDIYNYQFLPIRFKGNKEFVLKVIDHFGLAIEDIFETVPIELRRDKEVMLAAVKKSGITLSYASTVLQDDKELVIAAIQRNSYALQYASKRLKANAEVVSQIFNSTFGDVMIIESASESIKANKSIMLRAVQKDGFALQYASDELQHDKELVLAAVSKVGQYLEYVKPEFKNDRDVTLAAVNQNGFNLRLALLKFQEDKEVVITALKSYISTKGDKRDSNAFFIIRNIPNKLKEDEEVVKLIVASDPMYLKFLSEEIRNNKSIVLEAVQRDATVLEFASDELKNDREVVIAALNQSGYILEFNYVLEKFKNDKSIILEVVKKDGGVLYFVNDTLKKDRDIALAAVKQNGLALAYTSEELSDNEEIVLAAIEQNFKAVKEASDRLRKDKKIALKVIEQSAQGLDYLNDELRNDKEIVIESVKRNAESFIYASGKLRKDKEFQLELLKYSYRLPIYLTKVDEDFFRKAVKVNGEFFRHFEANTIDYDTNISTMSPIFDDPELIELSKIKSPLSTERERRMATGTRRNLSLTSSNLIEGYYDVSTDSVVLVANNINKKDASKIALHEVAHRGMVKMAKDLGGFDQLYDVLKSAEKELKEKTPLLLERTGHSSIEELISDYGFDIKTKEGEMQLLMELAARWAETLVDKPQPSWWKQFLKAIGEWLTSFTGKVLTEEEVTELIGGFVMYGSNRTFKETTPVVEDQTTVPMPEEGFSKIQLSEELQGEYESRIQDEDADYIIMDIISSPGIKFKTYKGLTVYYKKTEDNPTFPGWASSLEDHERAVDQHIATNNASANSLMDQYKAMQEKKAEEAKTPAPKKSKKGISILSRYEDITEDEWASLFPNGNVIGNSMKTTVTFRGVTYNTKINEVFSTYTSYIFTDTNNKKNKLIIEDFDKNAKMDYIDEPTGKVVGFRTIKDADGNLSDVQIDTIDENNQEIQSTETIDFDKTLEQIIPEEVPQTPEALVEDVVEVPFVETPKVVEPQAPPVVEAIEDYNGFKIGDLCQIGDKIYKIRSFSKSYDNYLVLASEKIGKYVSKSANIYNAASMKNIPEEEIVTATPEAKRVVAPTLQITPLVGDIIKVGQELYKVKVVNFDDYTVAANLIDDNIDDDVIYFIPFAKIESIVEHQKSNVKQGTTKSKKEEMLLGLLRHMSEFFNNSIPFEIVDRPGEAWAGVFRNGKILINLSMAEKDTPIHEFLHPFIYVISKENPELYKKLLQEMKVKVTNDFIVKENGLFFIKNNDSLYGDTRGYLTEEEAKEGVIEVNKNIYEAYLRHKALVSKEPLYKNADPEEEILVRILTERIVSVVEEDGFVDVVSFGKNDKGVESKVTLKDGYINRDKARDLYNKNSSFMSTFVAKMLAYIDKFLNMSVAFLKGNTNANFLYKINAVEYNPSTGSIRLHKPGNDKAYTVNIGKDHQTLKPNALFVMLSENFKKESEASIRKYTQEIIDVLKSHRGDNDYIDESYYDTADENGKKKYVKIDMSSHKSQVSRKVGDEASTGNNAPIDATGRQLKPISFVDAKYLGQENIEIEAKNQRIQDLTHYDSEGFFTDDNGNRLSDEDFDTLFEEQNSKIKTVTTVTMPITTTIDNLAAMITNRGLYAISLESYKESFEQLADKYSIKSADELTKFANTFRKRLLALQNTLETRLKSGDLTNEIRDNIIMNLREIKQLADPDFLKNNDYVDVAVNTVKTGFISLMRAEQMMHKIRTKVNYGNIYTYADKLEEVLLNAGIKVEYKPNNYFPIRLKKGVVEINKKRLIDEGIVPFDIARNLVGDIDSQRVFVDQVQKINKQILDDLKGASLTQDEIKQLNWDIAALRNFYATFSGFNRTLLKEYMSHLDYSSEYMEFSNTLVEAGLRMKELENSMVKLAGDWLFPYFDNLQKTALAQLSPELQAQKYVTKEKFIKLFKHADADITKLDYLFGTIVNTKDPINATVANMIADIVNNNYDTLAHMVAKTKNLKEEYFKPKGLDTTQKRAEYIKNNFLRKVKVYENEIDERGNTIKEDGKPRQVLVERWAIHTEFKDDEFDLARAAYIKSLPEILPPADFTPDTRTQYLTELHERREAITQWILDNKPKFKNDTFAKLMREDEAFRFMYNSYVQSNDKYGEVKLQYGIIPQAFLENAFLERKKKQVSGIKDFIARARDKNTSMPTKIWGSVKAAANYLVGAEEELYFDKENPDGTEYRSIKTQYLRHIDEVDLNFDLVDTLIGFADDSFRYGALRDIQANVENLRLILNGYHQGAITPRTVPKIDSNGQLIMDSILGRPKSKEALDNRLNKQLNSFIDDIFYGDSNKDARINLYSSAAYKKNLAKAKQMITEKKTPDEIYKETTFYLDKETNRWKSDDYQNVSVSLNKVANNVTLYTAVRSLAFNIMSTTRNLTIGNFTNLSEAYGGKYYSVKAYLQAQKIYAMDLPDNIKGFVLDERNKLNQILFDYQAIQGEYRDRYNKLVTDSSIISRLFTKDSLFFLQHVAEHQIQGTATIALLLDTMVKLKNGSEISLWEAHILDPKGVLTLRDDVDATSFDKTAFIRRLHEMNRSNHGNYSNLHKTVIQRQWYGTLLMTFRKHMYPTLKARFGKESVDYSKGVVVEGYHRAFWRKVANDIMTYGAQIGKYEVFSKDAKGKWTAEEQYGFNRSLFETVIGVLGLMVFTLLLAGGDDDKNKPGGISDGLAPDSKDDSTVKKWILTLFNGLYTDIAVTNPLGIYNPFVNQSEIYQEIKKITNNPVAVQYAYKQIADFINELTKGSESDKKLEKFEKTIPIIKHIDFFTDNDKYISGYLQYQSLIGTGTK